MVSVRSTKRVVAMAAATSGAAGSRYGRLKAHYDLLSSHLGVGDTLLPNTSYANFLKYVEIICLLN